MVSRKSFACMKFPANFHHKKHSQFINHLKWEHGQEMLLTSLKWHMPQPFQGDNQWNRKQSSNHILASWNKEKLQQISQPLEDSEVKILSAFSDYIN